MRTTKTLLRLGGCPGWSESSLGTQSLHWFCHVVAQIAAVHVQSYLIADLLKITCTFVKITLGPNKWGLRFFMYLIVKYVAWLKCSSTTQIWAATWQNKRNDLSAQRRLRSESSLCAQWVAKDPSFLHADSEDWSDWADAQADLNLHWAHVILLVLS